MSKKIQFTLQDDAISREEHHFAIGCVHCFNGLGGVKFGGGGLKLFLKHHEIIWKLKKKTEKY